ncbi:hypothetical protein GCM10022280_01810 [Sphingomonas swuensis]|uniref:Uncharacterized protein n=1 Tax=Sphingomonas swuensis TaxID=977800 RepID=A0ABP7S9F2_9SPHN
MLDLADGEALVAGPERTKRRAKPMGKFLKHEKANAEAPRGMHLAPGRQHRAAHSNGIGWVSHAGLYLAYTPCWQEGAMAHR